jgi:predicted glycoside hydrolase/deacetylase ChbG (UPF0249 family)
MKHLIVNADDFGLSPGTTAGILEAHGRGVLTSTSLMVDGAGAGEAARLARQAPRLSVGLHVEVPRGWQDLESGDARERCHAEIERQLELFGRLLDRSPTHLDSHHNRHRDETLAPVFVEVARELAIPLREHSGARYFSSFYGQWGGRSHPEHVEVDSLAAMLETEIDEGLTELGCHPAYADLDSSYNVEREVELRTLCDSRLPPLLATLGIELVSYHDYPRLVGARE